jgi:hypothetical protein
MYHEVDGRSAAKNMCTRNDSSASVEPFRWAGVVEGGSLAVQLHVPRVDTRTEYPWVVQVVLPTLDQEDLELMVQVGQSACDDTTTSTQFSICLTWAL